MAIAQKYFRQNQPIASYDWESFIAGVSYIKYFFLGTNEKPSGQAAVKGFKLTRNTTLSSPDNFTLDNTAADFTLDIELPLTIASANIIISAFIQHPNSEALTKFEVFKKSGSVETAMGSVEVETLAGGGTHRKRESLIIDDNTRQNFAIGDKLLVRVTTATSSEVFNFDPSGRVTATEDGTGVEIKTDSHIEIGFETQI